jgi:hypothetical protein
MSNYPPPGSTGPTRPMNTQPQNSQPTNQPPYQQSSYQQNPYQQGQPQFSQTPPPKKGGGGLKWVLLGCGGFILIGVVAIGGIFYFGYQKAKRAGLDPELMKRNPTLAAAKIAMMNNPDVEFISIDESKNTITVKDKKTGKVITINGDKAADGKIVVTEDGKEKVSIQGGKNGSVEVNTSEGNVKIGKGSDKMPDWLPEYPGVKIEGTYSVDNAESSGAGFNFVTEDSVDEVADFYEDALKKEGFKISKTTTTTNGQTNVSVVGNDTGYKRNVVINVSVLDGDTKVQVVSQTKK